MTMMNDNAGGQMLWRVHHSRLRIGVSRVSRLRAQDVAFGGFGPGFGPVVDSGRAGW